MRVGKKMEIGHALVIVEMHFPLFFMFELFYKYLRVERKKLVLEIQAFLLLVPIKIIKGIFVNIGGYSQ